MVDTKIIATFVIADDVLRRLGHHDHCLAQTSDAAVLLVAGLAARYFQNHHERTLSVCKTLYYTMYPRFIPPRARYAG